MSRSSLRRFGLCKGPLLCAGGLLLLSGLVALLCRLRGPLGFFRALALRLSSLLGGLLGLLPLTAAEILILAAVPCALCMLIIPAVRRGGAGLAQGLCRLCVLACALLLMFQLFFGVHYQAPPLAERLGLDVRPYSADELRGTMEWLLEQVNGLAPAVPRDAEGRCGFGGFDELAAAVGQGYEALAETLPAFDAPTRAVRPKPARLLSVMMSRFGITGLYFPFTAEAVVSVDNVQSHIPSTIAHEWAHARGVGPEAECNFAAYLACAASDDARARYSGALTAYIYVSNALYRYSYEDWAGVSSRLCAEARYDLQVQREHWQQYQGPAQEVGDAVNDAYIKATGQPDGVRSYGKMVDLLIAWRLSQ